MNANNDLKKDCERKAREVLKPFVHVDYECRELWINTIAENIYSCVTEALLSEHLIVQKRPNSLSASEYTRLVEWVKNPTREPANTAFTASACRDAARAIEESGLLIVQKRVEDLRYALGAVQMLIEEDIEEDRGFTFNRKKMLEKIEEALK